MLLPGQTTAGSPGSILIEFTLYGAVTPSLSLRHESTAGTQYFASVTPLTLVRLITSETR